MHPGIVIRVKQEQSEPKERKRRENVMESEKWMSCDTAATLNVDEIVNILDTDPKNGLSSSEASLRRSIHGNNDVGVIKSDPLYKKYAEQFRNPFIILLFVSAFISVCMAQYDDAVSITVAILIVVTVGFIQEYRSEQTLARLTQLLPPVCVCIRDNGAPMSIRASMLVPGDVILLSSGDRVPADLRLVSANELCVDESSFTGETEVKTKRVDVDLNHLDTNICYQGTMVTGGSGIGLVVCTGEKSRFGEMFKLMRLEEPPRTPLQRNMDTLGKQLSLYSLLVILVIVVIGWIQGRAILEMFNIGVSLAVAAIPEGLPIVVTVTLALGVMRMAKYEAIVKRLPAVEALGCVDFICSDKTGTLTSNTQRVTGIISCHDINLDKNELDIRVDDVNTMAILETCTLCNDAIKTSSRASPTERALLEAANSCGIDVESLNNENTRMSETPFSSEKKYMSVECLNNKLNTRTVYMKGAVEVVSSFCKLYSDSNRRMEEDLRRRIDSISRRVASNGNRVLAVARGSSLDELQFQGLVALADPPRPMVSGAIAVLKRCNVKVCMVTGDSKETALSIANQVGLPSENFTMALSGPEMDGMSDAALNEVIERCMCFYRTTPRHKVRIVKALQHQDHVVAMTGDGVNDGVAVRTADIGIAMGSTGTDVCKEAADMILLNDDFSTLVHAIEEGKSIFHNIRHFVKFQLSTSIAALVLISLATFLDTPGAPLNPMQILWINVIMDGPPAQSLGVEPVDPNALKKPPRHRKEQIVTLDLLFNVLFSATIIIAGTLFVFVAAMNDDGTLSARDTTLTFTAFVLFDMFNALGSRSSSRLIIGEVGLTTNTFFCLAVALSLLGQLAVIYLPPLQYVFQTEALSVTDLLWLVALASTVFILGETKKIVERSRVCRKRQYLANYRNSSKLLSL